MIDLPDDLLRAVREAIPWARTTLAGTCNFAVVAVQLPWRRGHASLIACWQEIEGLGGVVYRHVKAAQLELRTAPGRRTARVQIPSLVPDCLDRLVGLLRRAWLLAASPPKTGSERGSGRRGPSARQDRDAERSASAERCLDRSLSGCASAHDPAP